MIRNIFGMRELKKALHVVLFRPLIPSNTGNISRTCLGFGARLHLIKPLGFDLSEKEVRRAGLDHWEHVDLRVHDSWGAFMKTTVPSLLDNIKDSSSSSFSSNTDDGGDRLSVFLVSKRLKLGSTPIADVEFPPATKPGASGVALVFGNEVDGLSGLDQDARETLPAVYLPMEESVIRSYNLSNAVAMAVYEVHRQQHRKDPTDTRF